MGPIALARKCASGPNVGKPRAPYGTHTQASTEGSSIPVEPGLLWAKLVIPYGAFGVLPVGYLWVYPLFTVGPGPIPYIIFEGLLWVYPLFTVGPVHIPYFIFKGLLWAVLGTRYKTTAPKI